MQKTLFKPLKIGNLEFATNLVQGPLAGYSSAPFRLLIEKHGQPAYTCTEMISANTLVNVPNKKLRLTYRAPEEKTLCYQLSGRCPGTLAQAALHCQTLGADLIDINCGCPKKKIRKLSAGSKLLEDPEHLARIISTIKSAITCPLTIKIRHLPTNDWSQQYDCIKAIEEAGADAIIVHGRTHLDDYSIACDLERTAQIVQSVNIPIIANGDIKSGESAIQIQEKTGAAGLMISRSSMGRPWLFAEILAHANGIKKEPPSPAIRAQYFIEHLEGLIAIEGEKLAILQGRKLSKYYSRDLPGAAEFCQSFYQTTTWAGALALISQFYQ